MSDTFNSNQGRVKQIIAHSNRIANLETSIQHRQHLIEEQRRFITEERRKIDSERAKRDNIEAELLALLADPEPEKASEEGMVHAGHGLGHRVTSLGDAGTTSGWWVTDRGSGNVVFEVTDSGATRRHFREGDDASHTEQYRNRADFPTGPFMKVAKPEWVTA